MAAERGVRCTWPGAPVCLSPQYLPESSLALLFLLRCGWKLRGGVQLPLSLSTCAAGLADRTKDKWEGLLSNTPFKWLGVTLRRRQQMPSPERSVQGHASPRQHAAWPLSR